MKIALPYRILVLAVIIFGIALCSILAFVLGIKFEQNKLSRQPQQRTILTPSKTVQKMDEEMRQQTGLAPTEIITGTINEATDGSIVVGSNFKKITVNIDGEKTIVQQMKDVSPESLVSGTNVHIVAQIDKKGNYTAKTIQIIK